MKSSKKVPIKWTAPETISSFIYTLKTDVFSYSILVWEVFSDGEEPYKGLSNAEVKKMVSLSPFKGTCSDGCTTPFHEQYGSQHILLVEPLGFRVILR